MRILEKYVLKSYIGSFFFSITILMVLGVIGDILGFLDDIFKNNIPLTSILSFYLYFAPFAFVNMVPFAALISGVFVFNNLSKNHEVSAVITSGISLWAPVRPVILSTFVICLFTFIVNEKVVPATIISAGRIKHEELESHTDDLDRKTLRNIAVYGKDGVITFAKTYYPDDRELEDIIIYKEDQDKEVSEKINVKSAIWRDEGYWLGKDVLVFYRDSEGNFNLSPAVRSISKLPIKETPVEFMNTQWDPKLMSYKQLKDYIKLLSRNSLFSMQRLKVDLSYKLSFPFMAMITVLVGIPFSISSGRVNAFLGMVKGIAYAMTYVPFVALSLALGKSGILNPVVSAWLGIVIYGLWGAYMINYRS